VTDSKSEGQIEGANQLHQRVTHEPADWTVQIEGQHQEEKDVQHFPSPKLDEVSRRDRVERDLFELARIEGSYVVKVVREAEESDQNWEVNVLIEVVPALWIRGVKSNEGDSGLGVWVPFRIVGEEMMTNDVMVTPHQRRASDEIVTETTEEIEERRIEKGSVVGIVLDRQPDRRHPPTEQRGRQ